MSDSLVRARRKISFPPLKRNEHVVKLEEFFGSPVVREKVQLPDDVSFVFLCFTNRSGSNFLAELMASSGRYNRAGEFLNWPGIKAVAERRSFISFQEVFSDLVRRFQKGGRFFCKAAMAHLELLVRSGTLEQVLDRSRFILIERSDKLAQAISHAIAHSTGSFTSETKPQEPKRPLIYTREVIDRCLAIIATADHDNTVFFGRNGIVPVRVLYERLIEDPEGEIFSIARQLGIYDLEIVPENLKLVKQAGPLNEEWRQRYLADVT